jgi:hypothetical protein
MWDVILLAIVLLFFLACIGFLALVERLMER